jgi:hypothetical protein
VTEKLLYLFAGIAFSISWTSGHSGRWCLREDEETVYEIHQKTMMISWVVSGSDQTRQSADVLTGVLAAMNAERSPVAYYSMQFA